MTSSSVEQLATEMAAAEVSEDLKELDLDDFDDDDDYAYEEVEIESDDDEEDEGETLEAVTRSVHSLNATIPVNGANEAEDNQQSRGLKPGEVVRHPEVVDDFVRNFMVKMGLNRTLESFETEWYELASVGKLNKENLGPVPDVYWHNQELDGIVKELRAELIQAKAIAHRATSTWDKLRKERDFHRMHHKRVAQEKNKLVQDIKRLRTHYSQYEPTVRELRHKYECAMKEKMLMRLERDRLSAKLEAVEHSETMKGTARDAAAGGTAGTKEGSLKSTSKKKVDTSKSKKVGGKSLPTEPRTNPHEQLEFDPVDVESIAMQKTFKGHVMSIASVAIHPEKPIFATASDDTTWKMWSYPTGDLLMSGEGHSDWVAGIDFHPLGTHLASASGDATIKLWDFEEARCTATLCDHTQAVWDVQFHDTGDFLASGSLDHSARLWDLATLKTKTTFRGHVDSINALSWQPFSNNLCTGSSDKTVSIWDARSGLCVQTFYGHLNSCNDVKFNLRGDTVVSVDADGIIKLWDVRMVAEVATLNAGPHPANKIDIDRSGTIVAVASDSGSVMCYDLKTGKGVRALEGHEDAVQAVLFDPYGKFLISAGSDNTFRTWS